MKLTFLAGPLLGLAFLPACSTIEGIGKDISAVGKGVSHIANEARDEMFAPRRQYASAGEACDPAAGELAGGNGLPACDGHERAPIIMKRAR